LVVDIALSASGAKNTEENSLRNTKSIIEASSSSAKDDLGDIEKVQDDGFLLKWIADGALPLGGGAARDLNKMFGNKVYETSAFDKVRNSNFNIVAAEKLLNMWSGKQREVATTAWGTTREDKPIYARYSEDLIVKNDGKDRLADERVNETYMGRTRFLEPTLRNIASSFEDGADTGKSFRDNVTDINDWSVTELEAMKRNAAKYKNQLLNDTKMNEIEQENGNTVKISLKGAVGGGGSYVRNDGNSISGAGSYISGDKAQYYDAINRYGNKRAHFELLLNTLTQANLAPKKEDMGDYVSEPTSFTIPTSNRAKEVTIETTDIDGAYPNYSLNKLIKYIEEEGIIIKGGQAKKVEKKSSSGRVERKQ
jgi:hypothetical protein